MTYNKLLYLIETYNGEHDIRMHGFDFNAEEIEMIKKAVEKQIPRTPQYYGDGYSDGELVYDYAECPTCGKDNFEYDINDWGCNYCPNCGQALDWSEEE